MFKICKKKIQTRPMAVQESRTYPVADQEYRTCTVVVQESRTCSERQIRPENKPFSKTQLCFFYVRRYCLFFFQNILIYSNELCISFILDRQVRTGRRFGGSVTNRRGDWSGLGPGPGWGPPKKRGIAWTNQNFACFGFRIGFWRNSRSFGIMFTSGNSWTR